MVTVVWIFLYILYLLILWGVVDWNMIFGWYGRRHLLSVPHLIIEALLSTLAFLTVLFWTYLPAHYIMNRW